MKNYLLALILLSLTGTAIAQVPNEVNYQGRLREFGYPASGNRTMNFKIYNVASGGIPLWASGDVSVAVSSGAFSYNLSPLIDWRSGSFWIETTVAGQVYSPRQKLSSQIYSLHSKTAESVSVSMGNIYFSIGSSTYAVISSNGLSVNGTITVGSYSSDNWNTAYTDRLKWDGSNVSDPTTGRNSLGLGDLAVRNAGTIADSDVSASANISGSKINGWNATNWNTAYNDTSNAVAANTANAIVRRDSSGDSAFRNVIASTLIGDPNSGDYVVVQDWTTHTGTADPWWQLATAATCDTIYYATLFADDDAERAWIRGLATTNVANTEWCEVSMATAHQYGASDAMVLANTATVYVKKGRLVKFLIQNVVGSPMTKIVSIKVGGS